MITHEPSEHDARTSHDAGGDDAALLHAATRASAPHASAAGVAPEVAVARSAGATDGARWPPPALRVRPYRWYWLAQWPVQLGVWMQVVALGLFVYQSTHSVTAVGVVAAADGVPAVVLSLAGGLLADRFPRRRILLVTQSMLGVSAGTLALLVATGHAALWSVVVIAVAFGATDSVDLPTRQALVADLVKRDLVVNAVALGSVVGSATRIVGPSLAGLLIAWVGPAVCFAVLAVAYSAPIAVLLWIIPDIPPVAGAADRSPFGDLVEGLRVAARDPLVRGVLVAGGALAFLGVSYMPYLPVLARTQLHGGPQVLGILYSVGGIGGLAAGLFAAALGRNAPRLRMLVIGGAVYAVALLGISHSRTLWLTIPSLVALSFAFLFMNTAMMTLIQTETDPALRGRILGIFATLFAGLQPLGTLAYGLIGHVVYLFDAVGVGGIIVGATAVTVALRPSMRRRLAGP